MADKTCEALFLVYNKPLQLFIHSLFEGKNSMMIEDLSEEQLPIYNLPLGRTYIVKGGPGTGKTLMSYFRAYRLAGNSTIVQTWHSWLWNEITKLNKNPSEYQHKEFNYKWEAVADLFKQEVYPNIDKKCHLFLDEAQDFPKELLQILSQCFEKVTIFIDEHQSIDRTTRAHEVRQIFDIESNPYPLSINYRNTPDIFAVARLFFTGDPDLLPEKCHTKSIGQKPRIIINYAFQDVVDFLANYIVSFPHKVVGVVLPNREIRSNYFQALSSKRPKIDVQEYNSADRSNIFNMESNGLKLLTLNTVKGLEFDTVLICDVDKPLYQNVNSENEAGKRSHNKLYVACSRAKTELIFTCENYNANSFIMDILKTNGDLVEVFDDKISSYDNEDMPF